MNLPFEISKQEIVILKLLAEGKQNHFIADKLCLSEHTIKNHKSNICRKLKLSSTTELYQWATINATLLQNLGGGRKTILNLVNITKFQQNIIFSKIDYFFLSKICSVLIHQEVLGGSINLYEKFN